jgi:hypothetical protein
MKVSVYITVNTALVLALFKRKALRGQTTGFGVSFQAYAKSLHLNVIQSHMAQTNASGLNIVLI